MYDIVNRGLARLNKASVATGEVGSARAPANLGCGRFGRARFASKRTGAVFYWGGRGGSVVRRSANRWWDNSTDKLGEVCSVLNRWGLVMEEGLWWGGQVDSHSAKGGFRPGDNCDQTPEDYHIRTPFPFTIFLKNLVTMFDNYVNWYVQVQSCFSMKIIIIWGDVLYSFTIQRLGSIVLGYSLF